MNPSKHRQWHPAPAARAALHPIGHGGLCLVHLVRSASRAARGGPWRQLRQGPALPTAQRNQAFAPPWSAAPRSASLGAMFCRVSVELLLRWQPVSDWRGAAASASR
eukprot:3828395-Pyramimonas_sp.AAC.1